jgi:hypothetical protein
MEKLDKERYLKRVIVVCWIALALCFGIKLFGGNLFEIMCSNENFIKVCEYADNHLWAYYLLALSYAYLTNCFAILAMCGKWKFSKIEFTIYSITTVVGCGVKLFSPLLGVIFDIWNIVIMPCTFTLKTPKRHIWVLVGNILLIAFQMISLFVKNLSFEIVTNNGLLIGIIYSIDVALMTLLYYLYTNFLVQRKEN